MKKITYSTCLEFTVENCNLVASYCFAPFRIYSIYIYIYIRMHAPYAFYTRIQILNYVLFLIFLCGLPWDRFHSIKLTAVSLLGNRLMHKPKIMAINSETLVSKTKFL